MNTRFFLPALFAICLLASCSSSPDRAAHPTVAILDLKQPNGWMGMHLTSKKKRPQLIVRAFDGQPVRDQNIPGGLIMTPGHHTITLSARRYSKADLGQRFGEIGEMLGRKADNAPSRHDRQLRVNAMPGHDYTAHMRTNGDSFDYWIESVTEDEVVATTRR